MKFSTKVFAIIFAISMFVSANAFAAIDMTDTTADAVTFASEIDVNATTGTDLANPGNIFDTTADLGFGQDVDVSYYVRFDLSNGAQFITADPTLLSDNDAGVVAAGGVGESYVIFSVTAAGAPSAATADVVLTINAAGLKVFSESSVTISYAMYETAGQAVSETSALATDSEEMLNFDNALIATVTAVTSDAIDVTTSSVSFDDTDGYGTDVTKIGDVDLEVDGTSLWTDGLAAALTDIVTAATSLVLTGSFDAALDATTDQIYIDTAGDNCGTPDGGFPLASIDATTATLTLSTNAVDGTATVGAGGASICMAVDEAAAIAVGAITAVYDLTAAAGSDAADQTLGTLTTLAKNGATDTLNLALRGDTSYTNLVRVTNSGAVTGDVFITLINDAGDTVTFDLADVEGFDSSTLLSGASTSYISTAALYDAALVADATFDVGTGLLRLNVDSTCTEILVQAIALSKDGNVFTVIDSIDNATN